ncbi:zinc finger protein 41 homolog isoform X3 [Vulpes lagopus]|uniref:zinc finger protein 41 homolog isoform X3 n=1 Tax=Vulpes lagopus TaxID=494514 RepID=UPI001BC934A9|nr:zinc finger protein 41 homolog isoform X3 [Vulpes lagopus]
MWGPQGCEGSSGQPVSATGVSRREPVRPAPQGSGSRSQTPKGRCSQRKCFSRDSGETCSSPGSEEAHCLGVSGSCVQSTGSRMGLQTRNDGGDEPGWHPPPGCGGRRAGSAQTAGLPSSPAAGRYGSSKASRCSSTSVAQNKGSRSPKMLLMKRRSGPRGLGARLRRPHHVPSTQGLRAWATLLF